MTTRFFMAVWGAISLTSLAAQAQPATQPAPKPHAFQSAFEAYQPHTDDKPVDWKAANDTTAQIGGWRAYAKEASAPAVQPTPQTTAQPAPPTTPDISRVKP